MCNIYEGGTVNMKLASGKRNKEYQQEEQTQSAHVHFTWFAQVEDSRVCKVPDFISKLYGKIVLTNLVEEQKGQEGWDLNHDGQVVRFLSYSSILHNLVAALYVVFNINSIELSLRNPTSASSMSSCFNAHYFIAA